MTSKHLKKKTKKNNPYYRGGSKKGLIAIHESYL